MRRVLMIFLKFERQTGHEHPNGGTALDHYKSLLKEIGKSDAEIAAQFEALVEASE